MILRHAIFLLSLFLCLPSAKAMENWELIGGDLQPVTVHMWKSPDRSRANEHIAVQTPKHYMSLRPLSEEPKEEKFTSFVNPCFAVSSYKADQLLQDIKLNGGVQFGFTEESKAEPLEHNSWPHETLTLRFLDATAMDKMWEKFLKDASPNLSGHDKEFIGKIFKNVHYVNDKMRKEFDRYIQNHTEPSRRETTLYFTNTTMALGLLGEGKMWGQNVYYLDYPKYFKDELMYPPLPFVRTAFIEPIKSNFYTRAWNLSVEGIAWDLHETLKRQELIKIHKNIENKSYGLDSLPTSHQQEIIKMLNTNDTIESKRDTIHTYLKELGERYQAQQSYLSLAGWADTFWYREWK